MPELLQFLPNLNFTKFAFVYQLRLQRQFLNPIFYFVRFDSTQNFLVPHSPPQTSNAITAGNGRVFKAYIYIMWLYLFKRIYNVKNFFFFFHVNSTGHTNPIPNSKPNQSWLKPKETDATKMHSRGFQNGVAAANEQVV